MMTEQERRTTATEAAKRRMHDVWVAMGRQYRDNGKWRKGGKCQPDCTYCAMTPTVYRDAAGVIRQEVA